MEDLPVSQAGLIEQYSPASAWESFAVGRRLKPQAVWFCVDQNEMVWPSTRIWKILKVIPISSYPFVWWRCLGVCQQFLSQKHAKTTFILERIVAQHTIYIPYTISDAKLGVEAAESWTAHCTGVPPVVITAVKVKAPPCSPNVWLLVGLAWLSYLSCACGSIAVYLAIATLMKSWDVWFHAVMAHSEDTSLNLQQCDSVAQAGGSPVPGCKCRCFGLHDNFVSISFEIGSRKNRGWASLGVCSPERSWSFKHALVLQRCNNISPAWRTRHDILPFLLLSLSSNFRARASLAHSCVLFFLSQEFI